MNFPDKKYSVLVVDPPWQYRNKNTGGSMKSGSSAKYPIMSLEEICSLPVQSICEKDCVLFLWGTTPLADYPMEVMKRWGFKYKTKIYWLKEGRLGIGYWYRGSVEECFIGIKGNIPAFRSSERNVIISKPRKHSQKPEELFNLIETDIKNLNPKIELFAREKRDGYDSWGNEIEENNNKN